MIVVSLYFGDHILRGCYDWRVHLRADTRKVIISKQSWVVTPQIRCAVVCGKFIELMCRGVCAFNYSFLTTSTKLFKFFFVASYC